MWHGREWRTLLNLIDHLGPHTHTAEAMSQDIELLKSSVEANGGRMPKTDGAPKLSTWSQEASLLASAVNELRALKSVFIQANSKKGANTPKVEPVPVPVSAWPRIEMEMRLAQHRSLVARLIPKKED